MTDKRLDRLRELDRKISGSAGWGAWMTAAIEERDRLAGALGLPMRRITESQLTHYKALED